MHVGAGVTRLTPLDFVEIRYPGVIPAGLGKRMRGAVDNSVRTFIETSASDSLYGLEYHVEFRVLDFDVVGTGMSTISVEPNRRELLRPRSTYVTEPATSAQIRNQRVRQAQHRLKAIGFNPGLVDGVMGQQTQNSLRKFQRANSLPVTGQLDQTTRKALGVR